MLLEIYATGICGSDIHGFTGATGRRQVGQVMGHETVGRVLALGDGVGPEYGLEVGAVATVNPVMSCGTCAQCRAGAEQACPNRSVIGVDPAVSSAFADKMLAPAANVIPLPDTMPIEYGALIEPLSVGYHAVQRGRIGPDERVLVIGGGPVGQAVVLAARREGAAQVVVSEPSRIQAQAQRSARCGRPGSDHRGTSHRRHRRPGWPAVSRRRRRRHQRQPRFGPDGRPPGTTIVLVGMGEADLRLRAYEVSTQERSIVGSFCYSWEEFRATARWVGTAPDELGQLIDGRVDLAGSADAFTGLARGDNPASKILVLPQA